MERQPGDTCQVFYQEDLTHSKTFLINLIFYLDNCGIIM